LNPRKPPLQPQPPTTPEMERSAPFRRLWASCRCCCFYHHLSSLPTAGIELVFGFSGRCRCQPPYATTEIECFALISAVVRFIGRPYQQPPQPLTTAENERECTLCFSGRCHQRHPITTEIERACSFSAIGGSPWRPTTPQPQNRGFVLVSGGCGLSLSTHTSTPTDPQPPPGNRAFALDFRAGATSRTEKSSMYGLDFAVRNMAPFFDVLHR